MNLLLNDQRRKTIQNGLTKAGFYKGKIDGDFGPKTKAAIRLLQEELRDRYNYVGEIDGDYGYHTMDAIMDYQSSHGLIPDGIFGKLTANEMFPKFKDHHRDEKVKPDITDLNPYAKFPHEDGLSLIDFYGNPTDPHFERDNIIRLKLPYAMRLAWNSAIEINKIAVHKKVAETYGEFFVQLRDFYKEENLPMLGLDLFGGSYNKRKIRGGDRWSTHAYGISIDLDPAHNRLKWGPKYNFRKARFEDSIYTEMFRIAKHLGIYSLGENKGYDYMHFQCAWR